MKIEVLGVRNVMSVLMWTWQLMPVIPIKQIEIPEIGVHLQRIRQDGDAILVQNKWVVTEKQALKFSVLTKEVGK